MSGDELLLLGVLMGMKLEEHHREVEKELRNAYIELHRQCTYFLRVIGRGH